MGNAEKKWVNTKKDRFGQMDGWMEMGRLEFFVTYQTFPTTIDPFGRKYPLYSSFSVR